MSESTAVSPSVYSKDQPYPAVLIDNRLLTKPGSAKETRHLVLELGDGALAYEAGDSIGIFPLNRPEDVEEILQRLGASGAEIVALPRAAAPVALREALTAKLALAGPTRAVLEKFAAKATDPVAQARLAALVAPEAKEAATAFLVEREFVDLLAEFPSARFSPQEFVDMMRRLMPRLYSIASSPRVFPGEVHLTVAVVRYQTNGRDRVGVCSSFLADRVVAGKSSIPVFVSHSHFRPPPDGARDCIMVGPGTGIAPFRAFVQDRVAAGATGRNWVIFGDQRRATDFLYEEEWRQYLAAGQLARLDTAFSRDQQLQVYVQDRMRENAAEVWSWLAGGANFYVCGDAKRMAKDVDLVLHELIAAQGGFTPEQAADYVKQLKKDKRYQRDVY
jgi:sulfite reductase (NADPH) flavoprotein alpha-component